MMASEARTTNATALGQMGISMPPATTLMPKIARHNCASEMNRRTIEARSDAGRFILSPFSEMVFYFKLSTKLHSQYTPECSECQWGKTPPTHSIQDKSSMSQSVNDQIAVVSPSPEFSQ